MAYVIPSTHGAPQALVQLVQTYYRGAGKVLTSSTKTAQRSKDDQDYGVRQGIAEGIAAILTIERVKKFPLFTRHEMIMHWEVQKELNAAQRDGDWQFPDGDMASEVVDKLLALIDGEDGAIAEQYEARRRAEIRMGNIKPSATDVDWLQKELEEQMAGAAPLQALIESANRDALGKVNDAPVKG